MNSDDRCASDWADSAADTIRVMLKHLRELALSKTTFVPCEVSLLMKKVQVSSDKISFERSTHGAVPSPPKRKDLSGDDSSSGSVEFVTAECRCSRCWIPPKLVIPDTPPREEISPARSVTSLAAEENVQAVDAKRGGHKRVVLDSRNLVDKDSAKRRLGSKSTVNAHAEIVPRAPAVPLPLHASLRLARSGFETVEKETPWRPSFYEGINTT